VERNDFLRDWVYFHVAHRTLVEAGYRKNHFTHFASGPDCSLYYTHARRGEDLLALGPSADGVFGPCLYRHAELEGYLGARGVWLEGGLRENPAEERLRRPGAALLAARLDPAECSGLEALVNRWQRLELLDSENSLTANGSWFIAAMLDELREAGDDR
jgi:hypothetical protein